MLSCRPAAEIPAPSGHQCVNGISHRDLQKRCRVVRASHMMAIQTSCLGRRPHCIMQRCSSSAWRCRAVQTHARDLACVWHDCCIKGLQVLIPQPTHRTCLADLMQPAASSSAALSGHMPEHLLVCDSCLHISGQHSLSRAVACRHPLMTCPYMSMHHLQHHHHRLPCCTHRRREAP